MDYYNGESVVSQAGDCSVSLCLSDVSRETAYRIRHDAYHSVGALQDATPLLFSDKFDVGRPRIHLVRWHTMPVGSIRACVSRDTSDRRELTAWDAFSDEISTFCGQFPVVESNRFVISPKIDVPSAVLHALLFRMIAINAVIENAAFIITAVRESHVPFYERAMKLQSISSAKKYPGLSIDMVLMGGNFHAHKQAVESRMPQFFPSSEEIAEYADCLTKLQ